MSIDYEIASTDAVSAVKQMVAEMVNQAAAHAAAVNSAPTTTAAATSLRALQDLAFHPLAQGGLIAQYLHAAALDMKRLAGEESAIRSMEGNSLASMSRNTWSDEERRVYDSIDENDPKCKEKQNAVSSMYILNHWDEQSKETKERFFLENWGTKEGPQTEEEWKKFRARLEEKNGTTHDVEIKAGVKAIKADQNRKDRSEEIQRLQDQMVAQQNEIHANSATQQAPQSPNATSSPAASPQTANTPSGNVDKQASSKPVQNVSDDLFPDANIPQAQEVRTAQPVTVATKAPENNTGLSQDIPQGIEVDPDQITAPPQIRFQQAAARGR